MTRLLLVTGAVCMAAIASAHAQGGAGAHEGASTAGAGARAGNITSTGETVPNPGASQSGGTTSLDRGIQSRDNKIDTGICKGC